MRKSQGCPVSTIPSLCEKYMIVQKVIIQAGLGYKGAQ